MSTGIAFWLAMFLIYLGLCTVAGMIASMRERSFLGAFVLAFLLSPPFGIIISLLMNIELAQRQAQPLEHAGDERTCPFCAESIRRQATKCRYCGSTLPAAVREAPVTTPAPISPTPRTESGDGKFPGLAAWEDRIRSGQPLSVVIQELEQARDRREVTPAQFVAIRNILMRR